MAIRDFNKPTYINKAGRATIVGRPYVLLVSFLSFYFNVRTTLSQLTAAPRLKYILEVEILGWSFKIHWYIYPPFP